MGFYLTKLLTPLVLPPGSLLLLGFLGLVLWNRFRRCAMALVVISLVGGATVAWTQAQRAAAERDLAVAVSSFLEDLFRAADPRIGTVRDTTRMIDFMEIAERRVSEGFPARPAPRARLQLTLGIVYRNLSRNGTKPTHQQASAIRAR